jgi:hypothetical protein
MRSGINRIQAIQYQNVHIPINHRYQNPKKWAQVLSEDFPKQSRKHHQKRHQGKDLLPLSDKEKENSPFGNKTKRKRSHLS